MAKRNLLALSVLFGAACSTGRANPIVDTFADVFITYGTASYYNTSGTFQFSLQYAVWNTEIPQDLATDIANDPVVLALNYSISSFLISNLPQVALISDLTFLNDDSSTVGPLEGGTPVYITSSNGTIYGYGDFYFNYVSFPEEVLESYYPGYFAPTEQDSKLLTSSYNVQVSDLSTNTVYDGSVSFEVYDLNFQFLQAPEPTTLLSGGAALLALVVAARKRLLLEN